MHSQNLSFIGYLSYHSEKKVNFQRLWPNNSWNDILKLLHLRLNKVKVWVTFDRDDGGIKFQFYVSVNLISLIGYFVTVYLRRVNCKHANVWNYQYDPFRLILLR